MLLSSGTLLFSQSDPNPKTIAVKSLGGLPETDVLLMMMTEGVLTKNKENIFKYSGYLGISGFTQSEKESDKKRKNFNTGAEEECICYKSNEKIFDSPLPLYIYLFKNGDVEVWFYLNSSDKHTKFHSYFKEKTSLVSQENVLDYYGLGNNNTMAIISMLNGKRLDGSQGSLNGGEFSIFNYTVK